MQRVTAAFAAMLVALAARFARAQGPMEVLSSVESQSAYDYKNGIIQGNGAYSYITCYFSPGCVAKVRGAASGRGMNERCRYGQRRRRTTAQSIILAKDPSILDDVLTHPQPRIVRSLVPQ